MGGNVSLFATVHGRVQGVYFRAFVQQQAQTLGLNGYVRNLPGGRAVEVCAEGKRQALEELISLLSVGPAGARVDRVDTEWSEGGDNFDDFCIQH